MHTYTSRALHVLSVSSMESSLSSPLFISLAAVNLTIAVIKAFGYVLLHRKSQLGISIATVGTSIPIVCLVSSKRVDYDEGWQRSYFILVLLLCGLFIIYELEILFALCTKLANQSLLDCFQRIREERTKIRDLDKKLSRANLEQEELSRAAKGLLQAVSTFKDLRWDLWKRGSIIGVIISVCVILVWLSGSILRGAPFRLVFKILLFSTAGDYLILSVQYGVLAFRSDPTSARLSLSVPAFLCLGISAFGFSAFGFSGKYKDDSDFALFVWIFLTISNACALRIIIRLLVTRLIDILTSSAFIISKFADSTAVLQNPMRSTNSFDSVCIGEQFPCA